MKWRRYPKYKDSGIEWLGQVPEHWGVMQGRYIGRLLGSEAPTEDVFVEDGGGVPFVKVDDMNDVGPSLYLRTAESKIRRSSKLHGLIILFPKRGAAIFTNKVVYADASFMYDSNVMGWKIHDSDETKFYVYTLIARRLDDLADISTVPQINNKHILPTFFPRPPRSEQAQVVRFLDRETARIDALIEKKQRQIELLREKRAALISHAVTKGLDPNVKMKDSGIEWLGEVPVQWTATCLKYVSQIKGRIGFRGYSAADLVSEDEGALSLGGSNLSESGKLNLTKRTYLSWEKYDESPEIQVSQDDLLIGQRGTCGITVIVDQDIGPATINPSLVLIKQPKIDSRFLLYWLMSGYTRSVFDSYLNATAVPMLSQEQIGGILVLTPPTREQSEIASFLDRETARIDELVERVAFSNVKLHEYRTALISAAVTGKIDVREEAA